MTAKHICTMCVTLSVTDEHGNPISAEDLDEYGVKTQQTITIAGDNKYEVITSAGYAINLLRTLV